MNTNFNYFALNYLNDWYYWDSVLIKRIFSRRPKDEALAGLHRAATFYKVVRNFPTEGDGQKHRLESALDALMEISDQVTPENVVEKVSELAGKYLKHYG